MRAYQRILLAFLLVSHPSAANACDPVADPNCGSGGPGSRRASSVDCSLSGPWPCEQFSEEWRKLKEEGWLCIRNAYPRKGEVALTQEQRRAAEKQLELSLQSEGMKKANLTEDQAAKALLLLLIERFRARYGD